ncbi:hypothetical protein COV19_02805 [Candidatus Woesearchaeota archaeon CG10_big_fil_rev_8_21_14_0_10_44_13]|nr:MAG: hypothetical protein COV19_02805 [Candidatus Woesearchaeota archaeon CG10_big_fil_rev_8_21_14_0_10_44_13]
MPNKIFSTAAKIIVLLTLFLLIITLFFNYFSFELAKENLIETYKQIKLDQMNGMSARLQGVIERPLVMLLTISNLNKNDYMGQHLDYASQLFMEVDFSKEITYVDEGGISEFAYPYAEGKIGINYSDEPFFKESKEQTNYFIRQAYSPMGQEIWISVPVFKDDKNCSNCRFDGVLFARLDLDKLLDTVLGPMNSGKSPDYLVLIDNNGRILYHLDKDLQGKNFSDVIDKNTYPELWGIYNETSHNDEGSGEYSYITHKKGRYVAEKDLRKFTVYTSVYIDGMRWVLWDVSPTKEMDQISGIDQIKSVLYFDIFMMFILFAILISVIMLAWKKDL